ncbi:MAG: addiction module component, family protein [Deltaproteobacteria bacterium]|nr:MAG: addiction module component, family protein [Deltaproteobacteria bacterium]TMQ05306.1 MAG: addiction module component, family protein [Deltaproteobacteria bacterium]
MADPVRVLEDALALAVDERARIAHELIRSLEPGDDEAADALWRDEICKRVDEIEAGSAELEDWKTVRLRLEAASHK